MSKIFEETPSDKTMDQVLAEIDKNEQGQENTNIDPLNPNPPENQESPPGGEQTPPETPPEITTETPSEKPPDEKKEEKPPEPSPDGKKKEEEGQEKEFVMPDELKTVFPEAKSYTDVVTSYNTLVSERDTLKTEFKSEQAANAEMVEILESHDALTPFLKDMRGGKTLAQAIRNIPDIENLLKVPSLEEDEEAYKAYLKEEIQREEENKRKQEQATERRRIIEAAQKHAETMRDQFFKENKITPDEQKKFMSFVNVMTYGDPKTFQLPGDYLQKMHRAYKYDDDMRLAKEEQAKSEKAGKIAGRNEVIDAHVNGKLKKAGDTIPNLPSKGAPAKPPSESDQLINSFKTKSRIVETPA